MAERSNIDWCDSTFNGWIGCAKVSPGCANCYAENLMDKRWGKAEWGPKGTRVRTTESYWQEPRKWNETPFMQCSVCGWRGECDPEALCPGCDHPMIRVMRPALRRVFAHSLSDVFEPRADLWDMRVELLRLMRDTPNLQYLVLTKHPAEIWPMTINVAIGTSVETMEWAEKRIPVFLETLDRMKDLYAPSVRFLSVEPMLAPMSIGKWLGEDTINWVICGAESGPKRRPFEVQWAADLSLECHAAGVSFFMKQDLALKPGYQGRIPNWLWNMKDFPTFRKGYL